MTHRNPFDEIERDGMKTVNMLTLFILKIVRDKTPILLSYVYFTKRFSFVPYSLLNIITTIIHVIRKG